MIRIDVALPDPAAALGAGAFGAGALIRLERATDPAASFAEITTVAIVAGTFTYTYWDAAGTASSWYRWRPSVASPSTSSDYGPYSVAFQGTSQAGPTSYATLDRLLRLMETRPIQPARLLRLQELLGDATQQVIEECGHRDYFRHPATGTNTWLVDGDGTDIIHMHEGLISLDLLELSFDGGLNYVTVLATDYMLLGDSPYSQEPVPTGEPYFHVRFTGFGQQTNFPPTVRSARLTGARGWPAPPRTLVEATAQRARQLAYSDASYSGSSPGGPDEYGVMAPGDRFWPQSLFNFLQAERERFMGCHVGTRGMAYSRWARW